MNAVPGAARRRRTAGFGAIAVAAALLTSACAAGREAQTINQRPTIDGVNAQAGPIAVRYLSIVAPSGPFYPAGASMRMTGVFANQDGQTDVLTDMSSASVTGWGVYSSVSDGDQVATKSTSSASASASSTAPSTAAGAQSSSPSGSGSASGVVASQPPSSAATSSQAAAGGGAGAAAPQAGRTVRIPGGSRTSFGVPEATGALLLLGAKTRIYPGSTIRVTLTFARAGSITVSVPVQLTTAPTQATVPAPPGESDGNP